MSAARRPQRSRLDAALVDRGLAPNRSQARALVLEPEPVDGLGLDDVELLKKRVRTRIEEGLEELKRIL